MNEGDAVNELKDFHEKFCKFAENLKKKPKRNPSHRLRKVYLEKIVLKGPKHSVDAGATNFLFSYTTIVQRGIVSICLALK